MMFKSHSHCETSRATSQPFSREGANGRSPSQEDGSGAPEITGIIDAFWIQWIHWCFQCNHGNITRAHFFPPRTEYLVFKCHGVMLPMMHLVIGAGETKGDGGAKICWDSDDVIPDYVFSLSRSDSTRRDEDGDEDAVTPEELGQRKRTVLPGIANPCVTGSPTSQKYVTFMTNRTNISNNHFLSKFIWYAVLLFVFF